MFTNFVTCTNSNRWTVHGLNCTGGKSLCVLSLGTAAVKGLGAESTRCKLSPSLLQREGVLLKGTGLFTVSVLGAAVLVK